MPLQTAATWFSDSVPAWLVTGVVLMGGYAYDRASNTEQRISTIEAKTSRYEQDVQEIKDSVNRIEDVIINKE